MPWSRVSLNDLYAFMFMEQVGTGLWTGFSVLSVGIWI